jgi:predicted RNA binding protein YcfA (HicA-like mRNA interferase family)
MIVVKAFKRGGWIVSRQKGSHVIHAKAQRCKEEKIKREQ